MEKTTSKKKQVILVFLVLAIIIGGCIGAVGFYAKSTVTEGTYDMSSPAESMSVAPDENNFSQYLNDTLLLKTTDSKAVKTNLSSEVSINGDSIKLEGSDANTDVVKYIVSSFSGKICESFPSHEGDFGDGFADVPTVAIEKDDISEFEYKLGEVDPNNDDTAGEDDFYYFTVAAKEFDISKTDKVFPEGNASQLEPAIKNVTDSLSEMLDVESCEIKANGAKVEGKTNRLNDRIQNLSLSTDYTVQLTLSFKGDYAKLGKGTLTFDITVKEKYSYTWVEVTIEEDSMTIKPGEEEQLTVSAVISDKASEKDYKLSFKVSDESVASVDKDGYVKGLKISKEPVTVTITLEYLGNTYTDNCELFVINPVEKVVATPEAVTLKVGETAQLSCKITPEDATIKDVTWFTEDYAIADVDENGVVSAYASGTVKVFAVSKDGSFRSSCVVEVE